MYKKITLDNDLRLIMVPRPDSLSVNLLVLVGVGSNYETKELNGISHFMEHMCFKGTTKRPRAIDLSAELDALGAEYNAFTGREYTGYYVSCLPDKLEPALDILADMYLNPSFSESEIEKERGVIEEEINRSADNPSRVAQDLFVELLYGDTPYGWNTLGTESTLKKINRSAFLDYQKRFHHAKNTLVVVAGNFDQDYLPNIIEKYFSSVAKGEVISVEKTENLSNGPRLSLKKRLGAQTNIVLGFKTFGSCHPDYYTAEVLAGILGGTMSSRLFQKVREEMGAAYSINAYQTSFADYGYLSISGGVQSLRLKEVLKAILNEIILLTRELVPEKELARVKDSLIGTTYLNLETPSDLAAFYGIQEIRGETILSPEDLGKKIKAVTAQDVKTLAQKIFVTKGINLVILGPHDNQQEFVDILTL